jgi:hypothetical protein
MEVSVTGNNGRARMGWIAVGAGLLMLLAGLTWWMARPWANQTEMATLNGLRDRLAAFYEANPPIANWHIQSILVAPPGLVVSLAMPADRVAVIERRPVVDRLATAGAICPEGTDPIYRDLGRFSIEIHPTARGNPVLVNADCRNVRDVKPQ